MNKILMVEDDKTISFAVEYALKKEGFDIDIADDIESATKKIYSNTYDLLLFDVMLPDGNGYELCEKIRKNIDTPIIFLTACDEEVNITMGLDIGGDDYITKPFRVKELISRINAILRRMKRNNNSNQILEYKNIKIDTLSTKVFKDSEEILLTSVEYKLLLILTQNKEITLSRSKILEKLWDVSYDFVNDNTLTVYIKRLREKLGDDLSNPIYIKTIRGMGYKWIGCD